MKMSYKIVNNQSMDRSVVQFFNEEFTSCRFRIYDTNILKVIIASFEEMRYEWHNGSSLNLILEGMLVCFGEKLIKEKICRNNLACRKEDKVAHKVPMDIKDTSILKPNPPSKN